MVREESRDALRSEKGIPEHSEEAFEASVEGAYYAQQMAKAELEKRIGSFPAVEGFPVHTAWDIGVSDNTAIWCFQILHESVRIVGFLESSGEGLSFYLDKLQDMAIERWWKYGSHHLPADISVREWGTGKSRVEQMMMEVSKRHLGKRVARVPNITVDDGINAVRQLLGRCTFDAGPCAEGLSCLRSYRKDWNEEMGTWRDRPRHDCNSMLQMPCATWPSRFGNFRQQWSRCRSTIHRATSPFRRSHAG